MVQNTLLCKLENQTICGICWRTGASLVRFPQVKSVIEPKLVRTVITVYVAPLPVCGVGCQAVALHHLQVVPVDGRAALAGTVLRSDGGWCTVREVFW